MKMIVLIAPEIDVENEFEILNELFQEGLQYYHLRKQNKTFYDCKRYLDQIDSKYHNNIVVHHFHELLDNYNLKGIHFQEAKRRAVPLETLKHYRTQHGISMSSSFHSTEELMACSFEFDYHLLSPVFASISKQGYQGRGFNVNKINKTIIGMGGATTQNLNEFDRLGYQGIGVLGSIWQSDTPIEHFKTMQKHFNKQVL